ncbi:hypothetical protein IJD34_03485 [bacterium]|nr:hypothetical protein [bacterium]
MQKINKIGNIISKNNTILWNKFYGPKSCGKINLNGLKYLPQKLTTDVLEITQTKISKRTGATGAMSEYFSTSDSRVKLKACETIDKYLQKLALEDYNEQAGMPFEDFLQDLRLKFWDIVNRKRENGTFNPKIIMIEMKSQRIPPKPEQIETINIENFEKFAEQVESTDLATEMFELKDQIKYLIDFPRDGALSTKKKNLLKMLLLEGYRIKEIAEIIENTNDNTRKLLQRAIRGFDEIHKTSLSKEFLKERSSWGSKVVREIIAREESDGSRFIPRY